VTAGLTLGASAGAGLHASKPRTRECRYLESCGTGNLAFRRAAFDAVGGFDERFEYGSDTDFTWRLVDAGYRIRYVPEAVIWHDFGSWRRQLRRCYVYGKCNARLYAKHPSRLRLLLRDDPAMVAYPLFLLGLPLTLIFPFYPALLLIPAWRNRSTDPVRILVNNLVRAVGILAGWGERLWRSR
jgi:GT2 family glycosyltransferase